MKCFNCQLELDYITRVIDFDVTKADSYNVHDYDKVDVNHETILWECTNKDCIRYKLLVAEEVKKSDEEKYWELYSKT